MSAPVLVLNTGSSSLKYRVVDADDGTVAASGLVERIGEPGSRVVHAVDGEERVVEVDVADHEAAVAAALDAFAAHGPDLAHLGLVAVGHRVVHGGTRFSEPVLVDDDLVAAVHGLAPLAPLHNPANAVGLEAARRLFADLPHVAVFDTAFHATLPVAAHTYAVPAAWREAGVRRYGFHGTSVAFVSRAAAAALGRPIEETKQIVLHLGNGASATAVDGGRSVETSMGLTPLEGLVMGSRSGDLDPAVLGHVRRELGLSADDVDRALNASSGLRGLAGDNDVRGVVAAAEAGSADAELALDVYCHRVRAYVGAYLAALGGLDAVVLTGGVGENAAPVRARALAGLAHLGIEVDAGRNDAARGPSSATRISPDEAAVAVLVVPTDEEWEIARQTVEVVTAAAGPTVGP
ncbi:acetate kinase [Nocardioides sp. CFH 31398]|uniref:acetate kinase n=1 Tax=Nocardioides sp. CFH 31398 TaxID=2919579 RepID=UPI001F0705A9|nr:acetate kinase [Nocardioides sp. CFH 31398]MCH1865366.1 acetate kinase [Nocardioides sp. CFH 31398]MCH1868750.1 acetate kinase [Nocardioides sp. CFH 31398]